MKHSTKILIIKSTVFILILIWFCGILSSLLFPSLYPISKLFYSHICHQNENKIIYLYGRPLLVCARCTGIYIGVLAASTFLFFISLKKLKIKYLFISALPVLADVVLVQSGITAYSKYIAFITGFIFGSITFLYIWDGIAILLTERN